MLLKSLPIKTGGFFHTAKQNRVTSYQVPVTRAFASPGSHPVTGNREPVTALSPFKGPGELVPKLLHPIRIHIGRPHFGLQTIHHGFAMFFTLLPGFHQRFN
jgi:hypothetical protein